MVGTAADAAIRWDPEPVVRHVDVLAARDSGYAEGVETLVATIGDVAEQLHAAGQEDKVAELRGAVQQLLMARHKAGLHKQALDSLKSAYVASGEATDFGAAVEAAAARAGAAAGAYDPTSDPTYTDFLAAAGGGAPEDEEEQIDDDIAIAGGGHQLAPNNTCPISGKRIMELAEPVEDHKGYVYEKAAVLAMLRGATNPRGMQLVAGAPHFTRLQDLRPAHKVLRERKRLARRGATQQTQQQQAATEPIDVL